MSAYQPKKTLFSRIVVSAILFGFWVLLSGQIDVFHLSLGVICSALIGWVSHDLVIRELGVNKSRFRKFLRFVGYLPWLIYQVILANFHVAYLVLRPGQIDPQVIKYKSMLKNDFAQVAFANSITLTPGTITMDIVDGEYYVHALSQKVADDLMTGEMEEKIADVFLER